MTERRTHITPEQAALRRMQSLWVFFRCFRADPRPDSVAHALAVVRDLQLLRSPEHRYGIAGAVWGIVAQYPDLIEGWKGEFKQLIEESEGLEPDIDDLELKRVGEVDWLFMQGLVGGDISAIARVVRLASRKDDVGRAALALVVIHKTNADVVEALNEAAPEQEKVPVVTSETQHGLESAAATLAQELSAGPCVSLVIYVGVSMVRAPQWSHVLQVATPTGDTHPCIPKEWQGHEVHVREATPDEMDFHRRAKTALLDDV